MKRICSALLVLCLLLPLAGCVPSSSDGTPEGRTAPVSEPHPSPEDKTGTPGSPVFRLDSLPDVGAFVSDEKISYFFPEGPADAFTPRSDYGRLVLYAGEPVLVRSKVYFEYEDPVTGEPVRQRQDFKDEEYITNIGLAAADGRIVTAPLWRTCLSVVDLGGGKGYYLLARPSDDAFMDVYYSERDFVAFDGSWALHFDAPGASVIPDADGVDWFIVEDSVSRTAFLYSGLTGERLGDFSPVMPAPDAEYPEFDRPVYADGDLLILRGRAETDETGAPAGYRQDRNSDACTAFSVTGEALYELTCRRHVGGRVLQQNENDEVFYLADLRGEKQSETLYDCAVYDPARDLILAHRADKEAFGMDYFTGEGERVFPPEDAWTEKTWNALPDVYFRGWQNGVFAATDEQRAYDLFGRPIALPDSDEPLTVLSFLTLNYQTERYVLLALDGDGQYYLVTPDASLFLPVCPPKAYKKYDASSSVAGTETDGRACVVLLGEDDALYLYDLDTGSETRLAADGAVAELSASENRYLWLTAAGQAFVVLYVHAWDQEWNTRYRDVSVLISVADGSVKCRNVRASFASGGCFAVADDSASYLYGPDGALLYKERFGGVA